MKIVEYTPTKLKIQQNPPVRYWLVSLIFIIIGAIAIAGPEQVTTLSCDRTNSTQGICELSHSSLLFSDTTIIPLENLQTATIQSNTTSYNDSTRIILVTQTEQIPLNFKSYSTSANPTTIVDQINDYIEDIDRTSLTIKDDARLFSYLFGGIFIVVGIVGSGLFAQQYTCNFDKSKGSVTLSKKGLLWKKTEKKAMSEILGVQVESDRKKKEKNTYKLKLVLTSGKSIPLASAYESTRDEIQTIIGCLTTFLNVDVTNFW